jgi:hypothetical protein
MDNKEIIQKLHEILQSNNLCDEIQLLKKFNKEYKKTDFYKTTHVSLKTLYSQYKTESMLKLDVLFKNISSQLENLDTDAIVSALGAIDEETKQQLKEYKDLIKDIKINNDNQ